MKPFLMISSVFMLISNNLIFAQDNVKSGKYLVKIYFNGYYNYAEDNQYDRLLSQFYEYSYTKKNYDIGYLSFAVEVLKDKFFSTEFELMPLRFNRYDIMESIVIPQTNEKEIISGGKTTFLESTFQYQLNHYFNRDKLVVPYFGISSRLFYNYSKRNPATTSLFKKTEQNFGLIFSITPGLLIKVNNKLFVDINIPVGIYEIKLNSIKEDDPQLTLEDQKRSEIMGSFLPKTLNFRLGFIYKIY